MHALNLPYSGFSAPKFHKSAFAAILHVFVTQTTPANDMKQVKAFSWHPLVQTGKKCFTARNGYKVRIVYLAC